MRPPGCVSFSTEWSEFDLTPKKGRGIGAYLLVFVVLIGALVFLLTGMKGGGKETKYSDIMK